MATGMSKCISQTFLVGSMYPVYKRRLGENACLDNSLDRELIRVSCDMFCGNTEACQPSCLSVVQELREEQGEV